MSIYKDLTREAIPCWSKLVWTEPATISIFAHESLMREIMEPKSKIEGFQPDHIPFSATNDHWGFGVGLKRTSKTNDHFFGFEIELPSFKNSKKECCELCEGSGIDPDLANECLQCEGTGHEVYYDWPTITLVTANISLLTSLVSYNGLKRDTPSAETQLLSFMIFAQKDDYSIGGEYSTALVDWFRRLGEQALDEAEATMIKAWRAMMGSADIHNQRQIRAKVSGANGGCNISCPGNACGLDPIGIEIPKIGGYKFSCHNLDSPVQQLTLLAGLAAVEMQARRELHL